MRAFAEDFPGLSVTPDRPFAAAQASSAPSFAGIGTVGVSVAAHVAVVALALGLFAQTTGLDGTVDAIQVDLIEVAAAGSPARPDLPMIEPAPAVLPQPPAAAEPTAEAAAQDAPPELAPDMVAALPEPAPSVAPEPAPPAALIPPAPPVPPAIKAAMARPAMKEPAPRAAPAEPRERTRVAALPAPASRSDVPALSGSMSPVAYGALVAAAVRRNLVHPNLPGQSGVARVSLSVGPGGRIASAALAQSSGHAGLDQAALAAVRGIALPPPPNGRFAGTIPIRFELR
jgi:protein TonB